MAQAPLTVGFVGLGSMGLPMARNLLEAGHKLVVWNRTPGRAAALRDLGAEVADSPDGVAAPGGVVVSMVSNDAALMDVAAGGHGFGAALGPGGLHISMSTVAPQTSRDLARWHAERGQSLVAAPVFGRPDAAAAAKLFIPCSGGAEALQRALPLLEVLGQKVVPFGEDPGAANLVKLCGNQLLLAATQAMAESLRVAELGGLDRAAVMGFFTGSMFACPAYVNYGARVAARDFAPGGFKLSLAAKDLRLFAAQPGAEGLPLTRLVHDRLDRSLEAGEGDCDATVITRQVDGNRP